MILLLLLSYFLENAPKIVYAACTSESGVQTGALTSAETTVTSPNYPSAYPNHADQTWALAVPETHIVVVRIDDFQLESGFAHSYGSEYPPNCPYDFVRMSESCSGGSVVLWEGCGVQTVTEPIESQCSDVTLIFRTDLSVTYRGFSLTYWGESALPDVIAIDEAWFRDLDSTTDTTQTPCETRHVRGLMTCALVTAQHTYAQSFNYDNTDKICYLFGSQIGTYDNDVTLRLIRT